MKQKHIVTKQLSFLIAMIPSMPPIAYHCCNYSLALCDIRRSMMNQAVYNKRLMYSLWR